MVTEGCQLFLILTFKGSSQRLREKLELKSDV